MKKVITIVLMLALAGCWEPDSEEVVVLAGDSIAEQATRDINFSLLRKDNAPMVVNNAIGGAPLKSTVYGCGRLNAMHELLTSPPDSIILSAGTNDALFNGGQGTGTFPADINTIMNCVDPTTTVYWVTPHISPSYTQHVFTAANTWPNIVPVDFTPTPMQLQPDGIHLNTAGNAALVARLELEMQP